MNKYIRFYIFALFSILTLSQTIRAQEICIKEESKSHLNIGLKFNTFNIKEISYKDEVFHDISMDFITLPNDEGKPNIPFVNRYIAVPQGATAKVVVNDYKMEIINDVNVIPSRGYFYENEKHNHDYIKNADIYGKDEFYPSEIATLKNPTQLRGLDVIGLSISPVQYNPITKELIVYNEIDISIEFDGGNKHFGDDRLRSPYWDPIYECNILNYNQLPSIDYSKRMQSWIKNRDEGTEYIILIPNNEEFRPYAENLANFRRKQGIMTEVYTLAEAGVNSSEELQSWIRYIYNNWEIPPVAICLFGDNGGDLNLEIPAMTIPHSLDGTCISDNPYADVNQDYLPDICLSRIVASNIEEAERLITKQLDYEYNSPCMDEYYYNKPVAACGWSMSAWFQFCSESVVGYLRTIGKDPVRINGIYDYYSPDTWSYADNSDFIYNYFGPDGLGYIPSTPDEAGGFDGGSGAKALEAMNNGAYIIQHRDHGWNTIWYQPSLDISQLSMLNNTKHYPFMISVNCRTGAFNSSNDCLIEGFLRQTTPSGESCGIVGAIAPSAQSYSYANDAYAWGVWDFFENSFLPEWGTQTQYNNNYLPAFANISGKYFLSQYQFPNYYNDMFVTTCNIYHAHSDAFLRLFTEVPQTMPVNHSMAISSNSPSVMVIAPINCMIAITSEENDEVNILAVEKSLGLPKNIHLPDNLEPGTNLTIKITGQNYLQYENNIIVLEDETAYVVMSDFNFDNETKDLNYNDNTYLNLDMKNMGALVSTGGNVSLSCNSDKINITNNNTQFSNIDIFDELTLEDAFLINVVEGIPNKEKVTFTLTIEHDGIVHSQDFNVTVYSPELVMTDFSGEEMEGNNNNIIDPGENAKFKFTIKNISLFPLDNIQAKLISNDGYIRVITDDLTIDHLDVNQSADIEFEAFIEWNVGIDGLISMKLQLNQGAYTFENDVERIVAIFIEDFESETLNPEWLNDFSAPWFLDTQDVYEGNQSIRSGMIYDNGITNFSINYESNFNQYISFYYKVSTEDYYDVFRFFIDNELKLEESGNGSWVLAHYYVPQGNHNYRWEYSKDYSYSNGYDCVWIDYITFPGGYDEIEEIRNDNNLQIYPNPADNNISIEIRDHDDEEAIISIYNTLGIKVLEQRNTNSDIDISSYTPGLYFVKVNCKDKTYIKKLIIE